MLREFVWNAFENTGSIDAYILLRELENTPAQNTEKKITEEEVAISS